VRLLIATRKGLWTLASEPARNAWKLAGPQFLGHIVHHAVLDPRDGRTLLAAARTGHLGPTVFRSPDGGRTWKEATKPPAFAEGSGRVVDHTFWLAPGHASEPSVWYAGTSPQGLFRSADAGATWEGVSGFNQHPQRKAWCGGDQDGTPDGAKLHSILIDPRDPEAHVHRHVRWRRVRVHGPGRRLASDQQGGARRLPARSGSRVRARPRTACASRAVAPDRLYQQNHCGIYRLDRPNERWQDIGASMPKAVGSIGFPMVVHPRDPTPPGCFPWTARRCGRAPRRAEGPRSIARATRARPGSARTRGCPSRRRGGR
jgi:hypothetical protein